MTYLKDRYLDYRQVESIQTNISITGYRRVCSTAVVFKIHIFMEKNKLQNK